MVKCSHKHILRCATVWGCCNGTKSHLKHFIVWCPLCQNILSVFEWNVNTTEWNKLYYPIIFLDCVGGLKLGTEGMFTK